MDARRLTPLALLLTGLTLAAFLPVAENGFVSFDDDVYLTANATVREGLSWRTVRWAFTTTTAGNWHPLTWLSHLADVTLFGMDAGRHHLVGLAIHALSAVLLFRLLAAMTGAAGRSLLVASLFAVHPLHVEAVAWAAERKEVLAGLFWILACQSYLRYARHPSGARLALTTATLALGLLAKATLVTLPFALLLLDAWPLGRWRLGLRRLLSEKAPLFALVAAASAVTFLVQRAHDALAGPLLPLREQWANSLLSYTAYLGLTAWPRGLAFFYPFRSGLSPGATAAAALLLAGVTAAALAWRRRAPAAASGWFWYLGTLVPVIGLVQVGGQAMADRYTYLPLIGIFLALAWLPAWRAAGLRKPAAVAAAAAVLLLAGLARRQASVWRDDFSLYAHAVAHTHGNYVARTNLGHALVRAGRYAEALEVFAETSRVHPVEWRPHLGRGEALARLGRFAESEAALRRALTLNPATREAQAFNLLGQVLLQLGRFAEARREFLVALGIQPGHPEAAWGAGTAAVALGQPGEAATWFRRALAQRPEYAEAHHGLANALVMLGESGLAIEHLREALRLRPDFPAARRNLEQALRLPRLAPEARP